MIDLQRLLRFAEGSSCRIGIGGLTSSADELIGRLRSSGYEIHVQVFGTPESLVRSLVDGRVDGAVRGTFGSGEVLSRIRSQFDLDHTMRTALMEDMSGRPFMLTPVGIDEGRDMESRLELVRNTVSYFRGTGWKIKVGVLSKGRMEDGGRGSEIKKSIAEGDSIARQLSKEGIRAEHYSILLEEALGDCDVLLAPDGVTGNLIFRSLHLVAGAKAYGAPVLNVPVVFVDTSRAKADFLDSVLLAAAIVGMKRREQAQH